MRSLNLDQLQAFIAVIELGSFSAAADRLNLTQPAVSLQVRQLERRLGTALVERIGRRASPTAAGSELLAHADRIHAAVSAALEAVGRHGTGAPARVRLGAGATACIFLLPPVLRDLRMRFPGIEITVTTGNTADVLRDVEHNLLDLGLVTMPVAGRVFDVTPVLDDEFVAIAPPELQLPRRMTPTALSQLPLLLFEPGGNTRRIPDAWFARARVAAKPAMSLGSVEAIKEMVAAGLGCAILPSMGVRTARDRDRLVIRSLSPRLYRKLAVVIRRDKRLHRGLRETVDAIKGLAGGEQPA